MRARSNVTSTLPQSSVAPSDRELLGLFQTSPAQAWRLFIDHYADAMFSLIRSLAFDYDQTMDRLSWYPKSYPHSAFCAGAFNPTGTVVCGPGFVVGLVG